MALSIIIVNFRTAQLLLDCLTEMHKDAETADFEIVIVDNHSGDDSHQRVTTAFPRVVWVQMAYNAGFSRANNAGFRQATGDTMLLLNSDTLPRGAAIAECYRRLRHSEYVACGVQLLNADGTPQISGNYVMKGGLNYLLPLPYGGAVIKRLGEWAKIGKPHVPGKGGIVEVDWINGAFLMVKKEAIDQAGFMDEDFFLYAEESEWCGRLKNVGRICLYGDLEVVHLQGVTANQLFGSDGKGYINIFDRKGLQVMLSNFVRIRKQFGVGWFLVQLLFYIGDIPIFFLGMVGSRLAGKTRYTWTQFRQYCRNIAIVIGKSPIIIRNKPYFYKVI
ncbi:MAG TPA: glycosyltransferase family 2 protein [Puia sp.]|nr:glycosyltransferase family 2 protein [Puia sp.]